VEFLGHAKIQPAIRGHPKYQVKGLKLTHTVTPILSGHNIEKTRQCTKARTNQIRHKEEYQVQVEGIRTSFAVDKDRDQHQTNEDRNSSGNQDQARPHNN
jgi:hypothetical protein